MILLVLNVLPLKEISKERFFPCLGLSVSFKYFMLLAGMFCLHVIAHDVDYGKQQKLFSAK